MFTKLSNKNDTTQTSSTIQTFEMNSVKFSRIGEKKLTRDDIIATYAQQPINNYVSCNSEVVDFNAASNGLLLLNTPYSSSFSIKNESDVKQTVEFFANGFEELHEFVFEPNLCDLEPGEKRSIRATVTFKCTATLTRSSASICCAVKTEKCWDVLCPLEARTELTPFISADDVKIIKELGKGSYAVNY